jgi:hypothetical protein
VAEHAGPRGEIVSSEKQVGVAEPGRLHVDENFASYRRGDVYILEIEPATECVQHKRFHG